MRVWPYVVRYLSGISTLRSLLKDSKPLQTSHITSTNEERPFVPVPVPASVPPAIMGPSRSVSLAILLSAALCMSASLPQASPLPKECASSSGAGSFRFLSSSAELAMVRELGLLRRVWDGAEQRFTTLDDAGDWQILMHQQRFELLQRAGPYLYWLRRGPPYSDCARAGSTSRGPVARGYFADKSPGACFDKTTTFKIRHDLEQLEYLASKGWKETWLRTTVIPAYTLVLKRAEDAWAAERLLGAVGSDDPSAPPRRFGDDGYYQFDWLDLALVGSTYNRALVFATNDATNPSAPGGLFPTLGFRVHPRAMQHVRANTKEDDMYLAKKGAHVVVVDDALSKPALEQLLEYCRVSTVFHDTKTQHIGGYVGAYVWDGFAAPILFQIAEELRALMPRAIGSLPLLNVWAYKYSASMPGTGIDAHKDDGQVNVNLWISPTEANLEPERGGLMIFNDAGAISLAPGFALNKGEQGREALKKHPFVRVAFKQNRLVLFDSALIHHSDVGKWASGYLNRRISVTFIFGEARA